MTNQKEEQTAHKNATLKVEFKIHLITYIAVNTLLACINVIFTPGYLWVIWPVLGWGLGLVIHGINVRLSGRQSLKERMVAKEMKKAGLLILFTVLSANLFSQEEAVNSYSGYGGPFVSATIINDNAGYAVGGKGGAVIGEKLAFGGLGFGIVNPLEFAGNNLTDEIAVPLEMTFGAGGVFFEYIINPGYRIEFSVPVNIMAGGVHVYESSTDTEIESTALFILEPGLNIDLKISEFYSQSLFISYRQAIGSSLVNLGDADISGLNVGLMFKFRK